MVVPKVDFRAMRNPVQVVILDFNVAVVVIQADDFACKKLSGWTVEKSVGLLLKIQLPAPVHPGPKVRLVPMQHAFAILTQEAKEPAFPEPDGI